MTSNKLKVVTVVGTRPEIIRLSRVISLLRNAPSIQHTLLHTGQNYDFELNEIFFEDLGLDPPDKILNVVGKSSSETIGNTITQVDKALEEIKPDAFLILGDTNSCLSALSAKKRRIPVFHMEAGNRCFDMRVPEELNRKIVDTIADINLTYSHISREYLISEGYSADRIIKTGSPMFEVIQHYLPKAKKSNILEELGVKEEKYFVVSVHREENVESNTQFNGFKEILERISEDYKYPVIVTTHPRTRKKIETSNLKFPEQVRFCKPFRFTDYLKLQLHAFAVCSDSGTISEESSILNFHAINVRDVHERPEAMEEGAVMMTGMNPERVLQALKLLTFQNKKKRDFPIVTDYQKPNVSQKILRIILSYTDYVKRNVWKDFN